MILLVAACGGDDDGSGDPGWTRASALPLPLANNAVAAWDGDGGCTILTAMGIGEGRAAADITARAYTLRPGDDAWTEIPDVPASVPRIAASAVAIGGRFYVLGGYSVSPGGAEASTTEVHVYDPEDGWSTGVPLATAIDDAVAVAWRDRYIVVVSGWSDTAPVADVQIYDAQEDEWQAATAFPGSPVFGHAGALAGDSLVIVDGVASGVTGFSLVSQAWLGVLDADQPTEIAWTQLEPHPGPPRYRAAGGAVGERVVIHGGTDDPYNFDGLSYDTGEPSPPLASSVVYDVGAGAWLTDATDLPPDKPEATMDHRGLVSCGGALYTVGGMRGGPAVTKEVWALR